jgi:chitinase
MSRTPTVLILALAAACSGKVGAGPGPGSADAAGSGGGTDAPPGTADAPPGTADAPPGTADAPPQAAGLEVAPYFYTWGWGSTTYAFPSLAAMKSAGGPGAVTIAFVLSDNNQCKASTEVIDNLDDVKAYVAAGGHVKASFGGADGKYLESACGDADSLATAMSDWVTATGVTDLDFDIEQGTATSNPTINAMRATALAKVQAAKGIHVAFTLPVNPDGLDDLGKAVVQSALDAGVTISYVNVMTMDYGAGAGDLGQVAIGSADATAKQLVQMEPGLALADAYKQVGATPMIGTNDDGHVFSLANATAHATWAQQHHLGLLAFWAIQRDEKCTGGTDLDRCSGVNDTTFQFANVFEAVAGS